MSLFGPPDVAKLKAKGDVKGLVKALGYEKEQDVCNAAQEALGEIGAPAVEPLVGVLRDERKFVRVRAAGALGRIGGAQSVDSLEAALKDNDEEVRWIAALALGKIGDARAVEPLIGALTDERELVRLGAAQALGLIGDIRATKPLTEALNDTPAVRDMVVAALGELAQQLAKTQAGGAPSADASAPAASSPAVAAPTSSAPASAAKGEMPTAVEYESIAPEKMQRAIDLAEDYIGRGHPPDATMQMLGVPRTRPMYNVVQGNVGRESQPQIDMKIVSVVSCLPDEDVAMGDTAKIARMAFDAIQHYASLPKVQALFLLPYRLRTKTVAEGSAVPPEETCRVYSAVENLLLEIYDELPSGGTITDEVVEQKIDQLIKSVA